MICSCINVGLFFYGSTVLIEFIYYALIFAWKQMLPARNQLDKYGKDSWVVITGATDGIGKQLCFDFAALGFKIVLVSRSLDKLKSVASEVNEKHKV